MPKITQQSTAATLELQYASRTIQAPGNGSPERRKALTDITHTRNTPTKPIDFSSPKNSSFTTVQSAIHVSVSNSNSRPKRDVRKKSAKLDFRGEIEYFKPPLEPPVPVSQFQTLNSSIDSVSLPRPSLKANSLKKKVLSGVAYPRPPPMMLGAPKPVVQLKSVVQPKRPLHLKKSETPLDISKILSSSASKRQSTTREETEMDRIMKIEFEQVFASDTPNCVDSLPPSRKRKSFVFYDTESEDLTDIIDLSQSYSFFKGPPPFDDDNDLEVSLTKNKHSNDMPSAAIDVDVDAIISVGESCDSNDFSDAESEFETSSIASVSDISETSSVAFDEVDVSDEDDFEVEPAVKRVRTSLSPYTENSIGKDDRPFAQFMEEEGLVEVTRKWKKYPSGSKGEIKAGGTLWIDGEKTHVIISKATQDIMKKEGLWGKDLFIGKYGYVVATTDFKSLHLKIAAAKKNNDFHDLLKSGWIGKKAELEILHLNDNPTDFNVENLSWNTHHANLLLKLSRGTKRSKKAFYCSTNIDGKFENSSGCSTILEARHAADILKINNVEPFHQDVVFNHGLNFKYPSVQVLLSRSHLYKSKPTHQGKAFKSTGIITLLDWSQADAGLKKAVEDSKIPFNPKRDVLVHYHGTKGKGAQLMFVMERACYNTHILGQSVSLKIPSNGYVYILKEGYNNGIHRLVLGLKTGDKAKIGRHRVDGNDGKRDNRKRVLRPGNHASNMMDISRKTDTSTSQFDGIGWHKRSEKWQAQINFSNRHVKFKKGLGYFGVKGDKSKGEFEAFQWREKVKENVERINELLKDVTDLAVFKRKVNDEIKKIK